MVDSTSEKVSFNFETPDYISMDEPETAADTYFSNMFALIKLREQGVSWVCMVPQGVFRCILEYCKPAKLKRVSVHYKFNPRWPTNYTWPKQVSYQNPVKKVYGRLS